MSTNNITGVKTPLTGDEPVSSGAGLGVSPAHSSGISVRKAAEDVLLRAVKEMRVEGNWIYYGPLGRLHVSELKRMQLPLGVRPGWRKFSENVLISMRVAALTIMRKAIEAEGALKAAREQIPTSVYRELMMAIDKMRFEALMILKDIDAHLFDIKYAVYDII